MTTSTIYRLRPRVGFSAAILLERRVAYLYLIERNPDEPEHARRGARAFLATVPPEALAAAIATWIDDLAPSA